jgi:hypothetical protein
VKKAGLNVYGLACLEKPSLFSEVEWSQDSVLGNFQSHLSKLVFEVQATFIGTA